MAENSLQLQDPSLPSELITKKAESLGIDRGTFQNIYPQIKQQFGQINDAQLGLVLEEIARDKRNAPQAQVKESMGRQADLNRAIPWADHISENNDPAVMDLYNSRIKEYERRNATKKSLNDTLATHNDIDLGTGRTFYDKVQEKDKEEKDRIKRDTVDLQAGKAKILGEKNSALDKASASIQGNIGNLITNTTAQNTLAEQDQNSSVSKNYQKIGKSILTEFSAEDIAQMPASLIKNFIAFKQGQNKLSAEQLKLVAEVGKAQAEAEKAAAEGDKAHSEADSNRQFTKYIDKQGSNPNGVLVPTGPKSLSFNPVAVDEGKQKLTNQATIPGEVLNINNELEKLAKITVLLDQGEVLTGLAARIPGNSAVGPYKIGNQKMDKLVAGLKLRTAAEFFKGQGSVTEGERLLANEATISRSNDAKVIRDAVLDSAQILKANKKLLEGKLGDKPANSDLPSTERRSRLKRVD